MPGLNRLYYGDNLDVLRQNVATESVDLIYLDPPFNSNRSYNVLFKAQSGQESQAQIEAFDDTWHWSQQTEALYESMVAGGAPIKVAEAIEAMHKLLGPNDVLAYLVMMTARLVELHRVLKPAGSLYLHCDPTASHYLKVLLDAIFGTENFRNEVIWKRTTAHSSANRYGPVHDVLLLYSKTATFTWNQQYQSYNSLTWTQSTDSTTSVVAIAERSDRPWNEKWCKRPTVAGLRSDFGRPSLGRSHPSEVASWRYSDVPIGSGCAGSSR